MTRDQALARLMLLTGADTEPGLDAQELQALLSMSALVDSLGLAPSDADWTPTWDLNRGAAEGWRWKAAKLAASHFDFSADGAAFQRSQAVAHCQAQAQMYARRIVTSAVVVGPIRVWQERSGENVDAD